MPADVERCHLVPETPEQLARPEKPFDMAATLQFLERAFAEGADCLQPKGIPEKIWKKQIQVIGYYRYTDATFAEIGTSYQQTRQNAHLTLRNGMRNLWNNCSDQTRELFPLDMLKLQKPLSQRSRRRLSEVHGGASIKAAELLQAGKTVKEIQGALSPSRLQSVRATLRGWGVELPFVQPEIIETMKLAKRVAEATTDEEVQQLFDHIEKENKLNLCQNLAKGNNPLFVSLGRVVRSVFHARSNDYPLFTDALKRAQIKVPVVTVLHIVKSGLQKGIHSYFYLLTRHTERAVETFLADPTLERFLKNPVSQPYGPKCDVFPTTARLVLSGDFRSIAHLFAKFNIPLGGKSRFRVADFFTTDCAVSIFRWHDSHFYPTSQEENLHTFITKKLPELGKASLG